MTDPRPMSPPDWGLLIFLSLLWGGAFFFAGVAVRELPPMTVVLARVALAAAALLPVFWWMGHRLPRGRGWLPFFGMGLLNNAIPFGLIFAGQTYISVGLSSIVNAMTPLFSVAVLALAGEEKLTAGRLAGMILGLVGVAILQGLETGANAQTIGILLCMGGAISYGLSALWGKRFLAGVAPVKSATCQLLSSTLIMAVAVAIWDRPWMLPLPSAGAVGAIMALAIFGTALAYLVFFTILVRSGASNVMLVTLLIPVSAMTLGAIFLGESIHAREIAGAFLIALGLAFIDGRVLSWRWGGRAHEVK